MPVIYPNKITYLKTHPWQLAAAKGKPEFRAYKTPLTNPDGSRKDLAVTAHGLSQDIDGHACITFDPHLTCEGVKYKKLYIAMGDWAGVAEIIKGKVASALPHSAAGSSKLILPVTYRSQVDNSDSTGQGPGWRQCQLTSATMMLEAWKGAEWLNAQAKGFAQPEDWYASRLSAIGGETTDGSSHVALLNQMGLRCRYRFDLGIQDAKALIDRAIGSAIGLAYKSGGHICYLVGKDLQRGGLYLHDPYGIRDLTDTQALDTWEEIGGGGGAARYFNLAVIKDCWIDQGDRSGWGIWPEEDVFGIHYKKPSVTLPAVGGIVAASSDPVIPSGCSLLRPKQSTTLKTDPIDSSKLSESQRMMWRMDQSIVGMVSAAPSGHVLITLADSQKIGGRDTWYGFRAHFDITTPGGIAPSAPGSKITKAEIRAAADLIGVEARALEAVMTVEACGSGFLPDGRAKILFEALWFSDFTGGRYNDSNPSVSSARWDRSLYRGGAGEWDRLEEAMALDRASAIKSASWGLGQLMGAHSVECPAIAKAYNSDPELWMRSMNESEGKQLEAMALFISDNPGMLSALKSRNWAKFAYAYNGESYAENEYDLKLAEAYNACV